MSTASTRRLSSSDCGRSSFMKMLPMCLLTAFSETTRRTCSTLRPCPSVPDPAARTFCSQAANLHSKAEQPDGPGVDFLQGRPDEALAGEGVECASWGSHYDHA